MELKDISEKTRQKLKKIYQFLNPAELKRRVNKKLNLLYGTYKYLLKWLDTRTPFPVKREVENIYDLWFIMINDNKILMLSLKAEV
jgi:hypothetical protein